MLSELPNGNRSLDGDLARLVAGQRWIAVRLPRFALKMDIGQRLPVGVDMRPRREAVAQPGVARL